MARVSLSGNGHEYFGLPAALILLMRESLLPPSRNANLVLYLVN